MAERLPVVSLQDVSKVFAASGQRTTALQQLDLEISQGEFVSLIGPSGCGKSTVLRIIGDLLPPTTGTVRVNGKSARQARLDLDYGMVFQAPILFDWRTVQANVALPLEVTKIGRAERAQRVAKMLDSLNSAALPSTTPGNCLVVCSSASPSPGPWRSVLPSY